MSKGDKKAAVVGVATAKAGKDMPGALKEIFIQWAGGDRFDDLEVLIHEVASSIVYGLKADNCP